MSETVVASAVAIGIDELILGRELSCPIHDPNGVLLLAAGSVITADQKQSIKDRGISRIVISQEDLANTTCNDNLAEDAASKLLEQQLDQHIADRLQSVKGSGSNITNTGPALLKSVVQHGRTAHDRAFQQDVLRNNEEASKSIDSMMADVERGKLDEIDGDAVGGMAEALMNNLTTDIESALSATLGTKQPTLTKHTLQVATLAMSIGIELGLDANNIQILGTIGFVHDLGMARVPKRILEAKSVLTAVDFLEVQKHPAHTVNILEKISDLPNCVRLVAYQIHERLDGSGYPRGRKGHSIHLFARIVHVADAYTALTSPRPHRQAMMPYGALLCLLRQAQRNQVDPEVVRSLLFVLSLYPIDSFVSLSDGCVAQVVRSNGENYTRPVVRRIVDEAGNRFDLDDDDALIDLSKSDLEVNQALPAPGRNEMIFKPNAV